MKWIPIDQFDKSKVEWFLGWDVFCGPFGECRLIRWSSQFEIFLETNGCEPELTHFMPLPEGPTE